MQIRKNAERLRRARVEAGLTQPELGARLRPAHNKQQIYKYEVGKHKIKPDIAVQLGAIFNRPPEDFMDEDFLVSSEKIK